MGKSEKGTATMKRIRGQFSHEISIPFCSEPAPIDRGACTNGKRSQVGISPFSGGQARVSELVLESFLHEPRPRRTRAAFLWPVILNARNPSDYIFARPNGTSIAHSDRCTD